MHDNPSPHHLQAALETIGIHIGPHRARAVLNIMAHLQADDEACDQALMGGMGACEACEILAGVR